MSGSFDPRELAKHCELVLNGKTRTFMIQDVPKIIDGGETDDTDYEPEEPIEEEFDLTDIMGEETEDATLGLTRAEIAELERKKEAEAIEADRVLQSALKQLKKEGKMKDDDFKKKKKKKKNKKNKKKKEEL
jgi:hypothetical protein